MLFGSVNIRECNELVQMYSLASRTKSFDKSGIYFSSNTKVDDRRFFCHQLGVLEVPDLGHYLGMPSCVGRNKRGSIH